MNNVHFNTLNGKYIAWHDSTVFTVETGRGSKASYRVVGRFPGDLAAAVEAYNALPAGKGYKKRLSIPSNVLAVARG